jgi:hypothetical protein
MKIALGQNVYLTHIHTHTHTHRKKGNEEPLIIQIKLIYKIYFTLLWYLFHNSLNVTAWIAESEFIYEMGDWLWIVTYKMKVDVLAMLTMMFYV